MTVYPITISVMSITPFDNLPCYLVLSDTGARNRRTLCAINYNKTPGFEVIHGLLDRVMQLLEVPFGENGYHLTATNDPSYFPGCCAQIFIKRLPIGYMGVLHPEVISRFDLNLPCAALEIDIQDL